MKTPLPLLFALAASPVLAEETRQLDAHEHGTGELNIAVSGKTVAMELHVPGADIVGFEYEATSAEDRAAIDDAVAALARPLSLFVLPDAAECSVTAARAALESEEDEDHAHDEDHDHEDHDDHDHADEDKHDDHAEDEHDHDHDHAEEHDEDDHDHAEDHKDDEHDHAEAENHDDHDHEDHAEESSHSEFHAEYTMSCANPSELTEITFAYFERFENAEELEIQIATQTGARAAEVTRDAPVLDLRGMF
ncbi:MAG: DUF2796 domain-containing protein [Arenibacterium sp.]